MQPLLIALQFLTRIPIRLAGMPTAEQQGRSLLYYPLVGLLLGGLLWLLQQLLAGTAPLLQAALLLSAWVALSGGLHLDGLADSADAWVGGMGDRERTLALMKDPCCGPMAVVALLLVLLLKFAALVALLEDGTLAALLLAPLLGRSAVLALILGTPYVRQGGIGQLLASHLPHPAAKAVLLAVAVGCLLLFGTTGLWALLLAGVTLFGVRRALMRRLQGTTGDTAGALQELVECVVLVGLAL
ncbi:adenosylcobinamide-GDP ribazoletransferase [Pseudomonas sp.]|uniref:adenosylcobinamide-GDP ribazoletransferase n=1 Tax=Pseudomonas sp. TaxID=306 RepID=UPI00272EEACA|nr:adenosylcobinamide-GDP ribazoletransferase [Pseudomonas sp.]MDP2242403.1 adenosylcobinamide-GDP ribazoletransferase [Pseudomonas sp.]